MTVITTDNLKDLFDHLSPNQKKLYESIPRVEAWNITQISTELTRSFLVRMTDTLIKKELLEMVRTGLIQSHKNNSFKKVTPKFQEGEKNAIPIISGIIETTDEDNDLSKYILEKNLDPALKGLIKLTDRANKYSDKLRILRLEIDNFSEQLEDQIIEIQNRFVEIKGLQIDPEQLKKFEHFKALMDIK